MWRETKILLIDDDSERRREMAVILNFLGEEHLCCTSTAWQSEVEKLGAGKSLLCVLLGDVQAKGGVLELLKLLDKWDELLPVLLLGEGIPAEWGEELRQRVLASLEMPPSYNKLLDSLHFAGKTSASYVTERRSVSFAPQAASNFTPNGVRLMRFKLADQNGWLEGNTLRLCMTIHNATANPLRPVVESPASMFRRLRIIANGSAMIEDVEEYGRVHEMFSLLQSSERRYNAHAEGWGSTDVTSSTFNDPGRPDPIPGNSARTVVVKLLSSFLT